MHRCCANLFRGQLPLARQFLTTFYRNCRVASILGLFPHSTFVTVRGEQSNCRLCGGGV